MSTLDGGYEKANRSDFDIIKSKIIGVVGNLESQERLPSDTNEIYVAKTANEKFVVKIYDEEHSLRAGPSREIQMSQLLGHLPEVRGMLFSDVSRTVIPHDFAIFDYVEGDTLRSLIENHALSAERIAAISSQLVSFIKSVTSISTAKYGRLDEGGMTGRYNTWLDFLWDAHRSTSETFESVGVLPESVYLAPANVLRDKADLFVIDTPKLTPMDLHVGNVICTADSKIKIIDLKSFSSGDPLYGYSQFYSMTKNTPLGEAFMHKIPPFAHAEFKISFYALMSNLNVLAFIARTNPASVSEARPWGNRETFIELIAQHLANLERIEKSGSV